MIAKFILKLVTGGTKTIHATCVNQRLHQKGPEYEASASCILPNEWSVYRRLRPLFTGNYKNLYITFFLIVTLNNTGYNVFEYMVLYIRINKCSTSL